MATLDDYDRIVLWFEHDLYDQACLIALLDLLGPREGLYLLSIDRHPNYDRFIGFGHLSPSELAALSGTEQALEASHFTAAAKAYRAYRSGNEATVRAAASDPEIAEALPFLPAALDRHLAELPGDRDGLSLTERLTLQALADGAATAGECFGKLMRSLDPQPFLGDLLYREDIQRLSSAPHPALAPVPQKWSDPITLTPFGSALLAGNADWRAENGLNRWWGGKQLP